MLKAQKTINNFDDVPAIAKIPWHKLPKVTVAIAEFQQLTPKRFGLGSFLKNSKTVKGTNPPINGQRHKYVINGEYT